MKTKILRFLVISFAMGTLGSLSLTPTAAQVSPDEVQQRQAETEARIRERQAQTEARIRAQKEYNDSYNKGFEQGKADEQKKMDEQFMNKDSGCCGGGGGGM